MDHGLKPRQTDGEIRVIFPRGPGTPGSEVHFIEDSPTKFWFRPHWYLGYHSFKNATLSRVVGGSLGYSDNRRVQPHRNPRFALHLLNELTTFP